MTQPGLIGAVLYAKDLPRLVEFYAAVADLPVRTLDADHAVLGSASQQLAMAKIPEHIAGSVIIATPPARREGTPIKLVFSVANIAAARRIAAERGGLVNPAEREWDFEGATVCDGHDPEGNVFQLRSRG